MSVIDFAIKWFMGPFGNQLKELMLREVGYCSDMKRGVFRREVYSVDRLYLESYKISSKNLFFGVGFWLMSDSYEPDQNHMLYDRVVFDFDSESSDLAISLAFDFALKISKNHNVDVIVFKSGFKGAHVVIPLSKPTSWRGYSLLWDYFYSLIPQEHKPYVDLNIKQWNRLDRVPLTYNIKSGEKRLVEIVHPSIDPQNFDWSNLRKLDPSSITIHVLPHHKVVKITQHRGGKTVTAPCIVKLLNDVKNVELGHNARLVLASYMLCKGFSIDEVINVFSKQPDFNEKITRYQVEYIARKGLKPYGCDKMKHFGLCVSDCGLRNPLSHNLRAQLV